MTWLGFTLNYRLHYPEQPTETPLVAPETPRNLLADLGIGAMLLIGCCGAIVTLVALGLR
jgi:hypothetical protein